jgi:hypothetical protein
MLRMDYRKLLKRFIPPRLRRLVRLVVPAINEGDAAARFIATRGRMGSK